MSKKVKSKDLRLYIHLPIRAYKDKRLQQYRQALFVLSALCAYTNPMGICFPNQASLAKDLNVSRQAVTRYIKLLMEFGYVRYARKQFKGQKGNSYFIVYDRKTSESQAKKNISLSEFDIPDYEQREAQETLNKIGGKAVDKIDKSKSKRNLGVANDSSKGNVQVAYEETSEVAHNVSDNVNNNIRQPGNQLLESDIIYIKDPFRLNLQSDIQLKKFILISHYSFKSVDLTVYLILELEKRNILTNNTFKNYMNNFKKFA